MPVQKQLIPIPMDGGINTKYDDKQLPIGKLSDLQNGQFTKFGMINKRPGFTLLTGNISNNTIFNTGTTSTLLAGATIAVYNDQLVLMDGTFIYTYLQESQQWSPLGEAIACNTVDKLIIARQDAQQLNSDVATSDGTTVVAWEDSRGGILASVLDEATQAFAKSDFSVSNTGSQPKCLSFNGNLIILYINATANLLECQTISPGNPSATPSFILLASDGYNGFNGFPFDACVINNQLWIGYLSSATASGQINLICFDQNFSLVSSTVVNNTAGQAINAGFHGAVNVFSTKNGFRQQVWIAWANGVDLRQSQYNIVSPASPATVFSNVLVDTADVRNITGIQYPNSFSVMVHYEINNTNAYNQQVKYFSCSLTTGMTADFSNTIRSCGLIGKAFAANNNLYLPITYGGSAQPTDFICCSVHLLIQTSGGSEIDTNPVYIARLNDGISSGLRTNNTVSETPVISSNIFKLAHGRKGALISEAGTNFTLLGVNTTDLNLNLEDNFQVSPYQSTLLIAGGVLQGFDGNTVTEHNFHLFPDNVTATDSGNAGVLSVGQYQYQVCFEWTDNGLLKYFSAPSETVTYTSASGNQVTLGGSTLRITNKTNVCIGIYRTLVNGTQFFRVNSVISPLLNSTTSDTWTFTDNLSDASLAANAPLYTSGGVLSNECPPANSLITSYNGRAFLSGFADPNLLAFSQPITDNSNFNTTPPEFNTAQTTVSGLAMTVDSRDGGQAGPITALGVLNQTLIIFKLRSLFAVQGNGPDLTGLNSDYGNPTLITSDVGCDNPKSVVITPMGLMFHSLKGIYLLDQSLNVTYIGQEVEKYNDLNITGAVLHDVTNEVIFTTDTGLALVYNYFFQQWSTWTLPPTQSACMYNGNLMLLTPTGQVYQQDTTSFVDGPGKPISLSLTTPNLSMAGIQGYQIAYRAYLYGSFKSPHTLTVNVAYDDNPAYIQTVTITPTNNLTYTWGSDLFWGTSPYWGGAGYQIYEYRINFAKKKCKSIRLQILDAPVAPYGEGYAISHILLEVGILPGGNHLVAATNVKGTQ